MVSATGEHKRGIWPRQEVKEILHKNRTFELKSKNKQTEKKKISQQKKDLTVKGQGGECGTQMSRVAEVHVR